MRRTQSAVGLGLAFVVLVGILGLWLWGKPRASVPLPSASASPAQVVRIFAKALNDRDYPTAKSMVVGHQVGVDAEWWDLHGPRIEQLQIIATGPVTSASTCGAGTDSPWRQCVEVRTESELRHVKGLGETGKPDRQPWSYFLVRTGASTPWHIIDWGKD